MANNTLSPPSSPSRRKAVSVLFVCLGNICRSPMAHAVLAHLSARLPHSAVRIDSAGTAAYHTGAPPDARTTRTLEAHGIVGFEHQARKVRAADWDGFDWVLAMDEDNLEDLREMRARARAAGKQGEEGTARLGLFGDFGGRRGEVVLDPYYGGGEGFEAAFEQCVRFSRGWLGEVLGEEEEEEEDDNTAA